ncbi:YheC/YheD family protein [Neobacillus sp. OS1-2]|uniref:YheC/YheD family endospore coat-associated protein n=1 Tax=Neobacillus sp. OS1-2 TaxID=3070680 RepID=UPI0027DFC08B|nr:YheC/YheD family protein [Neobacillus sp. OS1-2]WML38635.1 YheC/YheD family protein [Neobacillus sp. OS1-2]
MITHNFSPLIGIMTSQKADGGIAGNGLLFTELQKKLISLNGISFVFIPEAAGEEYIIGYVYSPEDNRWHKKRFPYPDLVYNRIPFRKSEQNDQSQNFFSILRKKDVPFFNPCFIDKYELFQLLKSHDHLKQYLPQTILVDHKKKLFSFFTKYQEIYLKPRQSSKGKGIFRLRKKGSSRIELEGVNRQESYKSFHHFWDHWNKLLLEKNYLAQEEIRSAEYEGARFDFRILAHGNHNDYVLTGVGIRQSQEQAVTTHIPAGGRLLPYKLLQTSEHDQFFQTIVPQIGNALSKQFGYFGEFSIDAGISKTGQYYIYEVNSKPMSFDESEIEEGKIEQLCQLFLQLTGFQK